MRSVFVTDPWTLPLGSDTSVVTVGSDLPSLVLRSLILNARVSARTYARVVRWALLAAVAACHSNEVPPTPDAAVGNVSFVSGAVWGPTVGTALVQFAPTSPGSILVVAVGGSTSGVPRIPMVQTELLLGGMDPLCGKTAMLSAIVNVPAGTTSFTVAPNDATQPFIVYVLELAGASEEPLRAPFAHRWGGTDDPAVAPAIYAGAGMVAVSTLVDCSIVAGISTGNQFTGLDVVDGMNVAYHVTREPGTYGARWDHSGGSWVATTIVFR